MDNERLQCSLDEALSKLGKSAPGAQVCYKCCGLKQNKRGKECKVC